MTVRLTKPYGNPPRGAADMDARPTLIAMDMGGVFTPEIWIAVAEKTGIEKLRLTTRDIHDYDQLMRGRLALLREHNLKLRDIQAVIATLDPLPNNFCTCSS